VDRIGDWKAPSPPGTYAFRCRADERQGGSGQVPFLLAERAHSESARSMRAVKGNLDHSLEQMFEAEEEMEPDDLL
jgi:hypothetical protein